MIDSVAVDKSQAYYASIAEQLTRYFDLETNTQKYEEPFNLYAFHQNDFTKSFLTKASVYEKYSVFEHLLFRTVTGCTVDLVEDFCSTLVKLTPLLANPNKFHKKTVINGILVCTDSIPKEIEKKIKKFFYRKEYKWCFHGWSETSIAIVSLADNTVYFSNKNKNLKSLISFDKNIEKN